MSGALFSFSEADRPYEYSNLCRFSLLLFRKFPLTQSQRSTKEQSINNMFCQFAKNFEHHAQEVNEYRFYKDLISQDASGKRVQIYFNIRKAILIHKQVVNYAGLQMDKLFFTFEEWSTLINRIFSPYSNLAQILHQFQTNLERLCKANHPLKQSKETMNRITMTTLIECIVECTASIESNFDKHGKHIVEERNQKQKRVASNNPPGNNPPSSRNAKENHESPLKAAQRFYEEQNQVETYNNKLFDAANELKRKRMENQQHNSSKSRDKDDRSGSRENYGQDGGRTSQGKPGASRSPIVVRKEFEDPLLEKMKEEK